MTKATGEATDTKVTKVTVTTSATSTVDTNNPTAGQVITAKQGRNVTVVTAPPAAGKVAKVTVTKITDIAVTDFTLSSADDAATVYIGSTLQMSATDFAPTYADDLTVTWSVAPASASSATATTARRAC